MRGGNILKSQRYKKHFSFTFIPHNFFIHGSTPVIALSAPIQTALSSFWDYRELPDWMWPHFFVFLMVQTET